MARYTRDSGDQSSSKRRPPSSYQEAKKQKLVERYRSASGENPQYTSGSKAELIDRYRSSGSITPKYIPYSPTPLSTSPPTAYRLIIRLPPKPIDPVAIVELLHLLLSLDQAIIL